MGDLTAGLKRRLGGSLGRPPGSSLPAFGDILGSRKPSVRTLAYVTFFTIGILVTLNTLYVVMGGTSSVNLMDDTFIMRKQAVHHVLFDCGARCSPSRLLILQTSDGNSQYSKMLDISQDVHLAYAQHWRYSYLRWDGIAKGAKTWMATYNRIYLLNELYKQNRFHWVLFVDPDAMLLDINESVEKILDDRYAVIGCRGGEDPDMWWDINIGVAFFNLKHPSFGDIISKWHWKITWTPLRKAHKGSSENYVQMQGGAPVLDDQQMFHKIMQHYPNGRQIIKRYFGDESSLFNYEEGKIVKHLIRANFKDQNHRVQALQDLRGDFFVNAAASGALPPSLADGEHSATDGK